jgi:serine/threonine-protein kinase HipA
MQHCSAAKEDLEQLWRRMLFNVLVSNTDDHMRNHGFTLTEKGWRLSPAYDMNPNEMGNGLTLNISENSNAIDISLAVETAYLYQLKSEKAESILKEMHQEISNWRSVAKKFGISNSEIEQTKRAFRLVTKLDN